MGQPIIACWDGMPYWWFPDHHKWVYYDHGLGRVLIHLPVVV